MIFTVADMKNNLRYLLIPLLLCVIFILFFMPSLFDGEAGKVTMDKPVASGLLERYDHDVLLLFFGYAGCADVCTPRLEELAGMLGDDARMTDVRVLFINLTELEDPLLPDQFAKSFHRDFIGVYPEKSELDELRRQLDIYLARSLTKEYEFDHTAYLFLLKKEGAGYRLKTIYTHAPFQAKIIRNDLGRYGGI